MKISKKIMVSNMIIGFIVTILLSIMFLFVVNDFFRDNVFLNLEKDVLRISEFVKSQGPDVINGDRVAFGKNNVKRPITTAHVIIELDEDGELITNTAYEYPQDVTEAFYEVLHKSEAEQFNNAQLGKYPVVTYKMLTTYVEDGEEQVIQVIGLVYNHLIYQLLFKLMIPVLIVLFVVVILSFVLSSLFGRRITGPMDQLIEMSIRIGNKEKVKTTIKSGDEFQTIGIALEDMSLAINNKDLETKQFYEHVSHDLKTPLTIISGYAEGVNNGIFEDNKEPLDKIVKQSNILKSQIENVIYLSQLETNKQVFDFENICIEEIISEVLDDFEVIFVNNDIEVIFQPKDNRVLLLDREKIVRVMNNVVSNVVKHALPDHHLADTLVKEDTPSANDCTQLFVEVTEVKAGDQSGVSKDMVKVMFKDNGPGFSDEILENPFRGYHASDKTGNGIGLKIISMIMESHSGDVKIYNDECGAVVELWFPEIG